ncbi:hypothetical protein F4553_003876 [Allocatelliglobosispora scoriae]|uniref:Pyridoxamine 5'-phosphate oxidase family protein n=1 Tax=Allocatelliglobosispora scoriae TaxID=643052 RepID=A0A841BN42_9ACTN|nr:hypothetical protein [Allocatelliglobosispora scoriae]MBB5870497.1 hypothetical protein [Allocatelliglobosispora scoriae]
MSDVLVEEAAKKAAIAWVGIGDGTAYAVWVMPLEGRLHLVTGPGEQSLPGLAEAAADNATATVTLRGDHGGRVVTYPATITQLRPGSEEWERVAVQLAGKRLNAPGTAEALAARWAEQCLVVSLSPVPGAATAGAALPDASEATAPRPSTATTVTRKPFRLHRVRKPPTE